MASHFACSDKLPSAFELRQSLIVSNRSTAFVTFAAEGRPARKWSKGDAPGEYGGPPLDPRLRVTWGGKGKVDPLTSKTDYIWNIDLKDLKVTEDDDDANGKGNSEETDAAKGSGFLSLSRSINLDSMDVDLSAELNNPSKSTLERQVSIARVVPLDEAQRLRQETVIWRAAPTRGEAEKWAKGKKFVSGGTAKLLSEVQQKKAPRDPQKEREESLLRFQKLKTDLQLYTLGIGAACGVSAYFTYSPEVSLSYSMGLVGSLVYVRMLSTSVEAVGANTVSGAARGAVGQPRLLVPVVLVMLFNRWNQLLVPSYEVIPLQLIPMLVGFFTYKAATLVQTFQDVFATEESSLDETKS